MRVSDVTETVLTASSNSRAGITALLFPCAADEDALRHDSDMALSLRCTNHRKMNRQRTGVSFHRLVSGSVQACKERPGD